jgi:hypothetical protein
MFSDRATQFLFMYIRRWFIVIVSEAVSRAVYHVDLSNNAHDVIENPDAVG